MTNVHLPYHRAIRRRRILLTTALSRLNEEELDRAAAWLILEVVALVVGTIVYLTW